MKEENSKTTERGKKEEASSEGANRDRTNSVSKSMFLCVVIIVGTAPMRNSYEASKQDLLDSSN